MLPAFCRMLKIGRTGHDPFADNCLAAVREHPGDVFQQSAAGDMGDAVDGEVAQQIQHGLDVDSGRGEEFVGNGGAGFREDAVNAAAPSARKSPFCASE